MVVWLITVWCTWCLIYSHKVMMDFDEAQYSHLGCVVSCNISPWTLLVESLTRHCTQFYGCQPCFGIPHIICFRHGPDFDTINLFSCRQQSQLPLAFSCRAVERRRHSYMSLGRQSRRASLKDVGDELHTNFAPFSTFGPHADGELIYKK